MREAIGTHTESERSNDKQMENPHALDSAQDPSERCPVMETPSPSFDPYADRPLPTGRTALRSEVRRDGLWVSTVHVWLVNPSSSTVLLQKRSEQKDTFPGRWDISAAGHVGCRTTAVQAARAELAEELGVEIPVDRLQLSFVVPAEMAAVGGSNAYEHVYFLEWRGGDDNFALGAAEVTAVEWRPVEEVIRCLRSNDEGYSPRTANYVDAMEREIMKMIRASAG